MTRNAEVAQALRDLADELQARRDTYRARAFDRAAMAIEAAPDVARLAADGALQSIPGIGPGVEKRIQALLADRSARSSGHASGRASRHPTSRPSPPASVQDAPRTAGPASAATGQRSRRASRPARARRRAGRLVDVPDLRGDLHVHSRESDGRDTLAVMAEAAQRRGLEWMGLSDHGETLVIAHGLDRLRLAAQRREVAKVAAESLPILQGCEVDILKDGRLGLSRAALRRLDYAIGSIHGSFQLDADAQTKRLLAAIAAGIDILGHPTGRRMPRRPSIQAHWDVVFDAAREAGVLLEVNGSPERLDLPEPLARQALRHGCEFVVDSDAHSRLEFANLETGVEAARAARLPRTRVANTWSFERIEARLGRCRSA